MQKHLTDLTVRSLTATARVWDTQLKGFGISVGENRKSWIVRTGQKRTVRKIGSYPSMTLTAARKEAMKALSSAPTVETVNISVQDAFDEYERTHSAEHHSDLTRRYTRRFFDKYVIPDLGSKKLSQLNFGLLAGILPTNRPSEANHIFRSLRAFLNWCIRRDYISTNPLAGKSQPHKESSRHRVLTNDEIIRLWNTAEGQYGTIWKLLLLTGQRKSQILSLEWEWITEETIEFPPSIMKSKKSHAIPLGEYTASLLPEKQGRYVFPSSKGGHTVNIHTPKVPHDKKAKVTGYTHHDLRRTFASIHASIGTPLHIIEKLLHHTSGSLSGVALVYNRYSYFAEMVEATQNYENHLKSLLSAETVKP